MRKCTVYSSVDVGDGPENLPSKDLAALSVRILLDGLSVDMEMVKRERHNVHSGFWAALLLPTVMLD